MQVSLLADTVERDPDGLCSARFHADVETHDIDYAALSEGDAVTVGGRIYRITRVGKNCHAECPLVQAGRVCQLKNHCAFAVPEQEERQDAGKKANA